MRPESLIQLVGGGNARTVEEEWMGLFERDSSLEGLEEYSTVLAELVRQGRAEQAAALAWAAIETFSAKHAPEDALPVASAYLLAVGNNEELRGEVTGLYRKVYGEREGIEALLTESGLPGGRPVRRALRTLDLCLAVDAGDFLIGRDDHAAARIDEVDRSAWEYTITVGRDVEQIGAVLLADRFEPAAADDFHVMCQFARDDLLKKLADDPATIVISLCQKHGNKLGREALEMILVPRLLTEDDWKKWWTKARAAVKRFPNVQIDRRAPYTITVLDEAVTAEHVHLAGFDKLHDPVKQLEAVDAYLAGCNARGEDPSPDALTSCYEKLVAKAKKLKGADRSRSALLWIIVRRAGESAGVDNAKDGAVELFKSTPDPAVLFEQLSTDSLHEVACRTLVEAHPDDWQAQLQTLLPTFPMTACDREAKRLADAGTTEADFQAVVDVILASPIAHFEALAWLWNGPAAGPAIPQTAPLTLFSRLLRGLEDSRRSDLLSKDAVKKIAQRGRPVLSARRYERYRECLATIEPGMANALRTQIKRLDSLGRAVREDLLKHMEVKFPIVDNKPPTPPWAQVDVLWVTRASLLKKQDEIDHHVNVKMRDNAKAIGRAAEHGDLSENSEYKFALEERDLLRGRLAQMNSEMAAAKIIDPASVATDCIGICTRAVFKRVSDGDTYEMTLVGAWDSDGEKGWYNYKAPLAQKVLGIKIGDTVEFDHSSAQGQYEVVEIADALNEQEAHATSE